MEEGDLKGGFSGRLAKWRRERVEVKEESKVIFFCFCFYFLLF